MPPVPVITMIDHEAAETYLRAGGRGRGKESG